MHIVVDNYATHEYPRVQRWLAVRRVQHFLGISSCSTRWRPNLVDLARWRIGFNRITQRVL